MTRYNLDAYEDVDTRIHKFYDRYPSGRIVTEVIAYSDTQFIVKACVYRDDTQRDVSATGLAEERVGSSPVNKTSALENCETSAIGRALANLGLSAKGSRPSRQEMEKADRAEPKPTMGPDQYAAIADAMRSTDRLAVLDQIATKAATYDMTTEQRDTLRQVYVDVKASLTAEVAS